MERYWVMTAAVQTVVQWLLLMGTNRLRGWPGSPMRMGAAAFLGGVYTCLCLGFSWLGAPVWRLTALGLVGLTAFGLSRNALSRCGVFILLHLALEGLAPGVEQGLLRFLVSALGIGALCVMSQDRGQRFVPVELCYRGNRIRLTALRDTGNTLQDPVTGCSVLVVGADAANRLAGLTLHQLKSPIDTMQTVPGLRLIPYRTVGHDGGLLLALRIPDATIGSWKGSALVAFAPEGLDQEREYQGLIGGMA